MYKGCKQKKFKTNRKIKLNKISRTVELTKRGKITKYTINLDVATILKQE